MVKFKRWRTGTSVLLASGLISGTATPMLLPTPGIAQPLFSQSNQSSQARIAKGTLIRTTYEDGKRIVLKPDETMGIMLSVTRNITSPSGTILIPVGSEIDGHLRPVNGGTQFVADELILRDGRRFALNATSEVVTRRETLRRGAKTGSILQGAAIGGAAAAVLSEVFGDIGLIKVLGGAGLGAAGGWLLGRKNVEVVVVEPTGDLDLTLNSDLVLR